jgi:hypothetical protein
MPCAGGGTWMDGFDTSNLLQPNNMRHGLFGLLAVLDG